MTAHPMISSDGRSEELRRQLEADAAAWSQGAADAGLLDNDQLSELDTWLAGDGVRELGISETAGSFITASRAAARRRWWPGQASVGGALAIILILLILATPITLLSIVGLTAALIHRTLN